MLLKTACRNPEYLFLAMYVSVLHNHQCTLTDDITHNGLENPSGYHQNTLFYGGD